MQKKYTSFKTLDQDLKIAKLQSEIDIQSLKNNYHTLKITTAKEVSPKKLLSNITHQVGMSVFNVKGILFQFITSYAVKRVFKKRIR